MRKPRPRQDPAVPVDRRPSQEEISQRAYALWQDAGSPEGSSWEHWLQAERELTEAAAAEEQSTTPFSASGSSSMSGQGRS